MPNRNLNEQGLSQQSKPACAYCVDHESLQASDFLLIMKARLPQYVFNCFVASGFDREEAIVSMDTTAEGPNNSITIIENFIQKQYSGYPKYCGNFPSSLPFEFLPGNKSIIHNL